MERIKGFFLSNLILFLILFFAFLIRIYNISGNPAGFFCDEASIGYNAYTILTTGKDEFGKTLPVFFKAFGEYKNPVETYSTVLPVFFFGLNEFSVRLTSVIYGILSIIAIYLLLLELLHAHSFKKPVGLLGAFLLAVTPWHIHLSRVSLEGIMPYLFFTTLGLYFFLKTRKDAFNLFYAIFLFTLALYSYFPARIFIPIFCLFLFFYYLKFFIRNKVVTLFVFLYLVLFLTPLLMHLLSQDGFSRWKEVSIFSNPPQKTTIMNHILSNYLLHFSPDFLFLKGDAGLKDAFITRLSVAGFGELYFFQLPLIVLGMYYLFKKERKIFFLILIWLISYPTGSMFTVDQNPQATRSVIGVIPFTILSALGFWYAIFLSHIYLKRFHISITIMNILVSSVLVAYLAVYFISYPQYSSDYWGWQYGPKEIMGYFLKERNNFDKLVMSGDFNEAAIFIKFYDPKNLCHDKCIIGSTADYKPGLKQLFAVSIDKIKDLKNANFKTQKIIYYPNGKAAFLVGTFYP
ncbi:MAG: glycosyltransferase family 39 protein [Candidatus Levyibacteriota bacterium]